MESGFNQESVWSSAIEAQFCNWLKSTKGGNQVFLNISNEKETMKQKESEADWT